MLGDLLAKRPATKKVESFFATQVQLKVESMILDSKIQGKLNVMSMLSIILTLTSKVNLLLN